MLCINCSFLAFFFFLRNFFCSILYLFFSSGTLVTHTPNSASRSLWLCSFLVQYFLLFSLDNFRDSIPRLPPTTFSLFPGPSEDTSVSHQVLFSPRNPVWFFTTFSISLVAFPICSLPMMTFLFISLDAFAVAALTFLSLNPTSGSYQNWHVLTEFSSDYGSHFPISLYTWHLLFILLLWTQHGLETLESQLCSVECWFLS